MNHKLAYVLTYLTFSAMLIGGVVYLYWSFQSSKVLDIKNVPVPVRPLEISPEATVILHYNYCKRADVQGLVMGAIVSNSSKILLPDADETTPKFCKEFDVPVIIPGQATDGVYHLEYKAIYRVNPIKTDVETWQSQEFTVKHVPPLPDTDTTITSPSTTNIITTPTQQTTTTNDGRGNTTETTINNPPPQRSFISPAVDFINRLIKKVGL